MRYLVEATLKLGTEQTLLSAIDDRSLGQGSVAGGEYLHDMAQARIAENGTVTWVEACYCQVPLNEERPYWEVYFDLDRIKDAHNRKNCLHENGTQPRSCQGCDCTVKLEQRMATKGRSFLEALREKF